MTAGRPAGQPAVSFLGRNGGLTLNWSSDELTLTASDGHIIQAPGSISCSDTGRVLVSLNLPASFHPEDQNWDREYDVSGVTTTGLTVAATGVHLEHAAGNDNGRRRLDFVPLRCSLLRSDQIEWDRKEYFLKSTKIWGTCKFSYNGAAHILSMLDGVVTDKRHGLIRSKLVVVPDSPVSAFDSDSVLWLLALAQRCPWSAPIRCAYLGDKLVAVELAPNESPNYVTIPLIDWTAPAMKVFMEQALSAFDSRKQDLQLIRLVEYYVRSFANPVIEFKFIFASVFMEAFKFHWALNVGQKTANRKSNGLIRGFETGKLTSRGKPILYTFEDLLTEACQYYGHTVNAQFIDDRNALFHSGAPAGTQAGYDTYSALRPEMVTLHQQLDELVCRLVDYSGPRQSWWPRVGGDHL